MRGGCQWGSFVREDGGGVKVKKEVARGTI